MHADCSLFKYLNMYIYISFVVYVNLGILNLPLLLILLELTLSYWDILRGNT